MDVLIGPNTLPVTSSAPQSCHVTFDCACDWSKHGSAGLLCATVLSRDFWLCRRLVRTQSCWLALRHSFVTASWIPWKSCLPWPSSTDFRSTWTPVSAASCCHGDLFFSFSLYTCLFAMWPCHMVDECACDHLIRSCVCRIRWMRLRVTIGSIVR